MEIERDKNSSGWLPFRSLSVVYVVRTIPCNFVVFLMLCGTVYSICICLKFPLSHFNSFGYAHLC